MAIARRAAGPPRASVRVWAENWPALQLFLAMATQWRHAGMAGLRMGLDYAALPIVAGVLGLTLDAVLFARLRELETAYLKALAESS